MSDNTKGSFASAFLSVILLFFFWGFVAASNGVLIPMFKNDFQLDQTSSQLVDFAFYLAYFFGSLIYFAISFYSGDPINKIGYKKGIMIGLGVSACGALLFIPAVNSHTYQLFLAGLFIIGLGFALLQIVANPFVLRLGDASTATSRLSLAGGINSIGTTVGPVILAYILYGKVSSGGASALSLDKLKTPYLALAGILVLLAVMISVVKIPHERQPESRERSLGALQYPQLVFGMLAIFMYVGVEVTVPSNMSALLQLPEIKGIDHTQVDKYISLYWGSLMIGRMSGALSSFRLSKGLYNLLSVLVPLAVFGLVLGVNSLRGTDVSDLYVYLLWIALFIVVRYVSRDQPARTLILFSFASMIFLLVGLMTRGGATLIGDGVFRLTSGDIMLFSFMSCGLFCSVMWPCIFDLATTGLGRHTTQGSSLLIMMILGGAVLPPLQGMLSDSFGIQQSYWLPLAGFAYLAWYGFAAGNIARRNATHVAAIPVEGH